MISEELSTKSYEAVVPSKSCSLSGFKIKDFLQIASSLLLPLALGVFTVVITVEQQKAAQKQRDEDRVAAQLQRQQDQLASELQRKLERNLTEKRYQDDVFDTYIRDLATLLKDGDGSLTEKPVIATVSTLKTLNIFRQLDPSRNTRIIRFLHETKALTVINGSGPLDLSSAELETIDFRYLIRQGSLKDLFFNPALLESAIFKNSIMLNVNFVGTKFNEADFESVQLQKSDFSGSQFFNSTFSFSKLDTVLFIGSTFSNINFSNASLVNITFPSVKMDHVDFSLTNLNGVDFYYVHVSTANFQRAYCVGTIFSRAIISNGNFQHADLKRATFRNAEINNVSFIGANLYMADFTGTNITDEQLQSALSIQDALLTNGIVGQDPNLLKNGEANCNNSEVNDWIIRNGSIAMVMHDKKKSNCRFVLNSSTTGANMSQRVDLSKIWDYNAWPHSRAMLSADLSLGVSIQLRGIDSNGIISSDKMRGNSVSHN